MLLADAILVVHFLFIAFVLGGQGCILVGAFRRWTWIRRRGFRLAHLVAIAVVVVQSWVGMMCPLTLWESTCRRAAGETNYTDTFVGYWLGKFVYFDVPQWVFTTAYTVFGLIVLTSWFMVKPEKRKHSVPYKQPPDCRDR
jgi:hypothetical protein